MQEKPSENVTEHVYAEALRKATESYEELVEELSVLSLLNDTFRADLGFEDICKALIEFTTEAANVENASVMVMDHEREELRLLAAKSSYEDKIAVFENGRWSGKTFKLGEGIAGQVAKERKSVLIVDTLLDERFVKAKGQKVEVRSILSLPLIHGDWLHGVLNLSNSDPQAFDSIKEHVLNLIVSAASVALSRAIIVEELKRSNEKLSTQNKELVALVTFLGVSQDITGRKRAETALIESEEKYRTLFAESKDGVFISTPEGKFLDINPASVELFGYSSRKELLNVDIVRDLYVDPSQREKIRRLLDRQGFLKDYELSYRRKDGKIITVIETVTAVRGDSGEIVAYRGIQRDVTEQKKLQQQLLQAQKMESVGTLAGGIAHDFNNLLSGILGYASFMKSKMTKDDPFFAYVDTIERSSMRAAELTSQLLAFARGGKYDNKPVNLNRVVEEMLTIIGRTLDKSVEIEAKLDPQIPTVDADSGQLQQVLMNLCVNARDSMPAGGRMIIETGIEEISEEYARVRIGAEVRKYVLLSVSDTGFGMDEQTTKRIFEPFYTTKEEGKGTGLGLSMVYGVVKNHGGFIDVYSELGHGSKFKIYLPISGEPEVEIMPETETPRGGDETVLVVDDEETFRTLVKDTLEFHGYRVLPAVDGEQAVDIYKEQKKTIDLVILDMVMPKMGGHETFLKMKTYDPNVKVLLSTGYSQSGKAREIIDSGIGGFIQKPYKIRYAAIKSKKPAGLGELKEQYGQTLTTSRTRDPKLALLTF